MTSKSVQVSTTLPYLAVLPLIILGILSILATGGSSSGGGGAGGGQATPFRLLATDASFPSLFYQVEASSGASMLISGTGLRGFVGVRGLAFDPNSNTLYGTDTATTQLLTIDPATGAGTAVGALGFGRVEGLAFDPNSNTLYGTDAVPAQLLTIDPATGAGTAVGPTGNAMLGLAFR